MGHFGLYIRCIGHHFPNSWLRANKIQFKNKVNQLSNRQLQHRLHCGQSKKSIVKIIPDSTGFIASYGPTLAYRT
jgi:hypothetical protein